MSSGAGGRLHILILNWKDPVDRDAGGAERMVRRIAETWSAEGHDVEVFVPRRKLPATERRGGVTYVRRGSRATVFWAARDHLRRHGDRYDVVLESVSTRPFFAHELVGEKATALYHQMAREIWDLEFRFPLSWAGRRVLEPRWVRRMAGARIVADSVSTVADLADFGVACTEVAAPGWDGAVAELTRPAPAEDPRLLFMGRLVRHKRPGDAVAAFRQVQRVFPRARLDVVGDGYLRRGVEDQAAPFGSSVTIHGFLPEARKVELLDRADLVLVPGTREGWGIVAVEAASRGVPVVAYNVPGLRDSVADGQTGVLCPPDPGAMATAAVQLLQDPQRWRALAAGGPSWAGRFTWEAAATVIMSVLRQPVAPR